MMILGIIIFLVCCAFTFLMIQAGDKLVTDAREPIDGLRSTVSRAMGNSAMADTVMQDVVGIERNLKLTAAMQRQSAVYPDLYEEVMSYIPSFYRINAINATPTGNRTASVTMTGVIQSDQDYADLQIAMLRIPNTTNVTRGGFVTNRPFVPGLNENDQIGTPIKPGEGNIPSDPEARMADLIQRAANEPNGFLGINNFGTNQGPKGAMPNWSTVTITLQMNKNMRTPNPRATLDRQRVRAGAQNAFGGGR